MYIYCYGANRLNCLVGRLNRQKSKQMVAVCLAFNV
jgi:hypothetical protein